MSSRLPSPVTAANTLKWHNQRDTIDLCQGDQLARLAGEVAQNIAGQVNDAFQTNAGAPRRRMDLAATFTVGVWSNSRTDTLENVTVATPGLPDVATSILGLAKALCTDALDAGKAGTHTVTLSVTVAVYNS
ncbi:hypothetical protein [Ktedonospora formicarum]|uniref:Uncharacterized protein n=1 Tax=Ktedonospora formicarum TaxID=2778364 RepID=A0A8J3I6Q2_9CHLR|nr:hypothetical protein [Ktedonospora formicarum]GHO46429.1 hypothetical protein KSX_45920 [Ktedonospora formicarum]